MPTPERLRLIKDIESKRKSRVLVYVTGDRRGFETKIATDVFPFMLEHLQGFSQVNQIDLFLYTSGGLTIAASGLVALLREFTSTFSVLIPFKAHSAGTLIALGADSIVMSRVGQLSPVDPTITSPFSPTLPGVQPGAPARSLPVSVEDVIGFLDLARQEAGLKGETALATIFQELSSKVHPLALGSVYRAREQIKLIARRLLKTHTKNKYDTKQIDRIVSALTRELYSHDYIIGRKEADDALKLPVEQSNPGWDEPIWVLFKEYERLLELTVPYNADALLGELPSVKQTFTRAIIESSTSTHAFQTTKEITRVRISQPGLQEPVVGIQERTLSEGWVENAGV